MTDNIIRPNFGAKRDEEKKVRRPIKKCPQADHKLHSFAGLIERGLTSVTLDARYEEVQVPEEHKGSPVLILNFSHAFRASDFVYDEDGVSCTLSFSGHPFHCVVPWAAVFQMRDRNNSIVISYPLSVPVALIEEEGEEENDEDA